MKPLRKGSARTALAENLLDLIGPQTQHQPENPAADEGDGEVIFRLEADQIAAIVGGALEEAIRDMNGSLDSAYRANFWRYFNHNLWNLTRSLRASNLLGKV